MIEGLTNFIKNPEMRDYLQKIVDFEEKTLKEYETNPIFKGLNQTPYWEWSSIPMPWYKVKDLLLAEVVEKFGKKYYILKDRDSVKKALEEYQVYEEIGETSPEKIEEIPIDIFSVIEGYDDVKKLFSMSVETKEPTHILMIGPPASCKTVFLLEVGRLKDAFYFLGGSTTKVGMIDQLFTLKPQYVLLDEADKMNKEDFTALLSLMETGIVKEVKHNKTREMVLSSKVYAACNVENLPPELLSRFQFKLHFKPYTKEEFIRVAKNVLVKRENKDEDLSNYIALAVSNLTRDVRDCIGIARISKTKEDVDFLIRIKEKYGKR